MDIDEVITILKQKSNPAYLAGMKRFCIDTTKALGIPIPELRKLSKVIKKDHTPALELWETNLHEVRIPASMADAPPCVTLNQFDGWVKDVTLCDVD